MPSATKDREERLDWQSIHKRLEASWSALEQKLSPDTAAQQQILRARAKTLAQAPERTQTPDRTMEIVEFLLAYEHYGIASAYVQAVCPVRDLRTLTGTPAFVLGLVHVRGQIVPVINVKNFFDLPDKGLTDLNRVLILRAGHMEVGILADAILRVHQIPLSDLQPALPTLTGIRADYVRGVTKDSLVVFDIEKLLSDKRIIVDEG